ncbi:MAG: hypothetical protein GXO73_10780 [Calditrichaeota bacterium]|nr:hypothetical protein [Calditrichota bacterium]
MTNALNTPQQRRSWNGQRVPVLRTREDDLHENASFELALGIAKLKADWDGLFGGVCLAGNGFDREQHWGM